MRKWLAMVFVVVAACGVKTDDAPRVTRDDSVPFDLLDPAAPLLVPPATAPVTDQVLLCFVAEDHIETVIRELDNPVDITHVVNALLEPPSEAATLRTALAPALVTGLAVQGGVARVDLSPAVSNLGGNNQLLAVAQLACTLTARPGVGQVSFTIEGAPVEVPRGDGSLTNQPVSGDDYASLVRAPAAP